jgi:uncharacterized protein HemX
MDNQNGQNPFLSVHTPIALVALALSVLFFNQIKGTGQAVENMKVQSENADKQIKELKENTEKASGVIEQQKPNVAQSEATQKQFSELIKELDELSRGGDKDAQQVMQIAAKAGINYTPGPAPEAAEKKKEEKKDAKAK